MRATDLFNYKKEEFETVETFAKRVYETAKRYRSSLIFTHIESVKVINTLAKYYNESYTDMLSAVRSLELCRPSEKYRIQWVQCLGIHYLVVDKR